MAISFCKAIITGIINVLTSSIEKMLEEQNPFILIFMTIPNIFTLTSIATGVGISCVMTIIKEFSKIIEKIAKAKMSLSYFYRNDVPSKMIEAAEIIFNKTSKVIKPTLLKVIEEKLKVSEINLDFPPNTNSTMSGMVEYESKVKKQVADQLNSISISSANAKSTVKTLEAKLKEIKKKILSLLYINELYVENHVYELTPKFSKNYFLMSFGISIQNDSFLKTLTAAMAGCKSGSIPALSDLIEPMELKELDKLFGFLFEEEEEFYIEEWDEEEEKEEEEEEEEEDFDFETFEGSFLMGGEDENELTDDSLMEQIINTANLPGEDIKESLNSMASLQSSANTETTSTTQPATASGATASGATSTGTTTTGTAVAGATASGATSTTGSSNQAETKKPDAADAAKNAGTNVDAKKQEAFSSKIANAFSKMTNLKSYNMENLKAFTDVNVKALNNYLMAGTGGLGLQMMIDKWKQVQGEGFVDGICALMSFSKEVTNMMKRERKVYDGLIEILEKYFKDSMKTYKYVIKNSNLSSLIKDIMKDLGVKSNKEKEKEKLNTFTELYKLMEQINIGPINISTLISMIISGCQSLISNLPMEVTQMMADAIPKVVSAVLSIFTNILKIFFGALTQLDISTDVLPDKPLDKLKPLIKLLKI